MMKLYFQFSQVPGLICGIGFFKTAFSGCLNDGLVWPWPERRSPSLQSGLSLKSFTEAFLTLDPARLSKRICNSPEIINLDI
ncbi:MAG: hypothetical protein C0433_00405 [Cyclobacterium sp.]|nr:hypothetical protein [Cyclobacterium sp.]